MKRMLIALVMMGALAQAQEKEADKTTVRIIPIHYVNVNHLRELLNLPGVHVSVKADSDMRVLVVSGAPDAVATVEELVKKLDAPPQETIRPDIETTAYLVEGSARANDDVPATLSSVVKQLHALFPYKGYRMLDSCVLRGHDRSFSSTSGALPELGGSYDFAYSATVMGGTPRVVQLDQLRLTVNKPTNVVDKDGHMNYDHFQIRTNIDAAEGQKVVVGKSSISGEDALILVVTAKVIE